MVLIYGITAHVVSYICAVLCQFTTHQLRLTDWVSFLVLDIGDAEIESIPIGTRMIIGVLQAAAVRAAGFSALSLAALAPAVKFVLRTSFSILYLALTTSSCRVLYVIMM